MNLYLAPMEEITGFVYRNTLDKHFGCVDKYFTPFVTPNQNKILKTREGRELIPEHNKGLNVVPQILTNNSEHFNELADYIESLGYKEININCGCPSNTVVKKSKGSGILRDPFLLDRFLDGVFSHDTGLAISVKTRVGYLDDEDFDDIMKIYNKYPMKELIVHPRTQKDFYKGSPRMEKFDYAYNNASMELSYNGNIFSLKDYENIVNKYPKITSVMIGRGAIMNPDIFAYIKNGKRADNKALQAFVNELFENYSLEFGKIDGLYKLKEFWSYFQEYFMEKVDKNILDKQLKQIRKTKDPVEYKNAVNIIFSSIN